MVQNDSYKLCKMLEEVAGCKVYFNSGERMEYPVSVFKTHQSHMCLQTITSTFKGVRIKDTLLLATVKTQS